MAIRFFEAPLFAIDDFKAILDVDVWRYRAHQAWFLLIDMTILLELISIRNYVLIFLYDLSINIIHLQTLFFDISVNIVTILLLLNVILILIFNYFEGFRASLVGLDLVEVGVYVEGVRF